MTKQRNQELQIVVVDDSDFSRNSVVSILEEEGFNVIGQANNAQDAFSVCMTTAANLFLIDVVMPEISGIELAKMIGEKKMGVYIIMMSSLDTEHIVIESISMGAVDFLPKPFERENLIKAVEKIEAQFNNGD